MTYRFDDDNSTLLNLITGHKLARRIKHATTVPEKALLAVDLSHGLIEYPTLMQAAAIVGVCRQYVYAVSAVADDNEKRRALLAGTLSLPDLLRKKNGNGNLAYHLAQATDEELVEAARTVGIKHVWDRMIEPLI
jgi:hypothetical protein